MPLKNLLGRGLSRVEDIPVIHTCVCYKTERVLIEELPEHDIFIHGRRLEFVLVAQVKDLQRPLLSLQRYDQPIPVHNGAIRLDRPSDDIVRILEVDDYDFRLRVVVDFLPNANVVI